MAKKSKRYKILEQYMTYGLFADGVVFLLYLLFAALGVPFLKFLTAILVLGLSGLCLWVLYVNRELTRRRSLWMTCGAVAIVICLCVSLITKFPG